MRAAACAKCETVRGWRHLRGPGGPKPSVLSLEWIWMSSAHKLASDPGDGVRHPGSKYTRGEWWAWSLGIAQESQAAVCKEVEKGPQASEDKVSAP